MCTPMNTTWKPQTKARRPKAAAEAPAESAAPRQRPGRRIWSRWMRAAEIRLAQTKGQRHDQHAGGTSGGEHQQRRLASPVAPRISAASSGHHAAEKTARTSPAAAATPMAKAGSPLG